jgi:hypothetical protein
MMPVPNLLQSPVAIRLLRMFRTVSLPIITVIAQPIRLALLLIRPVNRIALHPAPLPGRFPGPLALLLPTVTLILLTRIGNEISPTMTTGYLLHSLHNHNLL